MGLPPPETSGVRGWGNRQEQMGSVEMGKLRIGYCVDARVSAKQRTEVGGENGGRESVRETGRQTGREGMTDFLCGGGEGARPCGSTCVGSES